MLLFILAAVTYVTAIPHLIPPLVPIMRTAMPEPGSNPSPSPSTSPSPVPTPSPSPSPSPAPAPSPSPSPSPGNASPPKSVPMNDTALAERAKDYRTAMYKLVLVGDNKYVLPEGYTKQGSLYYNFVPKPDDIILISYTRAGYLWFSELLYQLTNGIPGVQGAIESRVPLLESLLEKGEQISSLPVDSLKSPRVIRTHLPPSLIPSIINGGAKVLYVARNPKDILVSLHKYIQTNFNFSGTVDRLFYYMEQDRALYSPYWTHTKEGLGLNGKPNALAVFAEEFQQPGLIEKVAKFLGKNVTSSDTDKLKTVMGQIEQIDLITWPKVFSKDLNTAFNNWIKPNIGNITFPNIPDLYA